MNQGLTGQQIAVEFRKVREGYEVRLVRVDGLVQRFGVWEERDVAETLANRLIRGLTFLGARVEDRRAAEVRVQPQPQERAR